MQIPFLQDAVIILLVSIPVMLFFHRFRLPSLLGLLLTGVIAGPYGLSFVHEVHEVELIAEVGVVFLLFIIGLEFSLSNLSRIRRVVLLGGGIQALGVTLLTFLVFWVAGLPWGAAVFWGFLLTLSSTAIVLKLLQEQDLVSTSYGKVSLGILIFQDIAVVPMMLLVPLLAGRQDGDSGDWGLLLLKLGALGVGTWVLTRYLVPSLLYSVAKTMSQELFLLTNIAICFAVAWITQALGLSLALGAFLAGLIISESGYSHQVTSNVLPFRELFTSFFFVSIGMLLDVSFLWQNAPQVLLLTLGVLGLKGSVGFGVARLLGYPPRTGLLVGLLLCQVGEFSFLLSKVGISYGLLTEQMNQYFLSTSIMTMALTPFIVAYGEDMLRWVFRHSGLGRWISLGAPLSEERPTALQNHVVIIGYGLNGRNVAHACRFAGIPYTVCDLDPQQVAVARKAGEDIVFGDATHEHILSHLHVGTARVIVVAISGLKHTRQIVRSIRQLSASAEVIVRTRYVQEIPMLTKIGANEVIPEEFETSIQIFSRVLNNYLVAEADIDLLTQEVRAGNYQLLHPVGPGGSHPRALSEPFALPEVTIATLQVAGGEVAGKPLCDTCVRQRYGVSVLAIRRDERFLFDIDRNTEILKGDQLYVLGRQVDIERFQQEGLQ